MFITDHGRTYEVRTESEVLDFINAVTVLSTFEHTEVEETIRQAEIWQRQQDRALIEGMMR